MSSAALSGFTGSTPAYQRRRPEETDLYRVIRANYRTFVNFCEEESRPLPSFVQREFEKYLSCGILSEGFARVHCRSCGYDRLVAFSCKGRGWCPSCLGRRMSDGAAFLVDHVIGDTPVRHWVLSLPPPLRYLLAYDTTLLSEVLGAFLLSVFQFLRWKGKEVLGLRSVSLAHPGAVSVIQRASGHLALNIHFHSLVSDGVFVRDEPDGPLTFHELPPPSDDEVTAVAWETCRRTRDILIRAGRWVDDENRANEDPLAEREPALASLYQASVRGVLSLGPRRGQRVVQFYGEAARDLDDDSGIRRVGYGFNLHASQHIAAGDSQGLERLARYILRPPLAQTRLKLRADGRVALRLKRPWRDGTAGMLFEPLDFLGKLVALVPPPRMNTIRFHGVYSAHATLRPEVVPVQETEAEGACCKQGQDTPKSRSHRLSWAQLLARVFALDVLECPQCSSRLQRIAWITDRRVIQKILQAVGHPTDSPEPHPPRSPEEVFQESTAA